MDNNICHFIPFNKDYNSIHTINFVLETKEQVYTTLKSQSVYKMHYVQSGTGNIHIAGKVIPLTQGDVFFTFPGFPHSIESIENFTYMYISFLGSRGNMIMDMLKISPQNFIFHKCDKIYDFWKNGLNTSKELSDLISESILLYSFYYLGNRIILPNAKSITEKNTALIIKKYIDDNISEHKLTLDRMSAELSYSPKYISSVFKKAFNVGISEYLNTVRVQNACTLINQGFMNVTDIANRCGYEDAQYFSKVFKQKTGVSPKGYIKSYEN